MKASAEKTGSTTSTRHASQQPFFPKAGGGTFFPAIQRAPSSCPAIQLKLAVNRPGDKLEREADSMAERVMRMPAPAAPLERERERQPGAERRSEGQGAALQRSPAAGVQCSGGGAVPSVGPSAQAAIQGSTGGQPLSGDVRGFMESRFSTDFSQVRVHTDSEAASLSNQLSARAFTYQNHIFFSRDQYQPGSSEGRQLLAHELTHTIQQGHAVQRSPHVATTTTPPAVQRLGADDARERFADWAQTLIPGFRLLAIVLGFNPITNRRTDRSAANILRALIELIPGGSAITRALDNHGVVNKAALWVEQKLATLGDIGGDIVGALKRFLDSLKWSDIFNLEGVWERAKSLFSTPAQQLVSFAAGVVREILQIVKDAILKPLAAQAQGTRGYDLLRALLGEDPISGEHVPPSPEVLIGGFMKLIGQEEIWSNLQKGNAVARAWRWFQGALADLLAFARSIPSRVVETLASLTFEDVLTVVGAFGKIAGTFVSLAGTFISWGLKQVMGLLEILFSVVAPGVMPYITKARAAFGTILKNPIAFVGNLVRAGKLGFQMFASNILEHLKSALIKWLVGPLAEAGVYIPQSFSLIEIVKLVLSVLGLTWQNIRGKLVKILPEPVLVGLEKTEGVLVTLVKDGPAAAWEQIKAELMELKDQLIAQVTQMISGEIVKAAIGKLVSMLNPAGAVIQAIVAIYNTVTFFIEKAQQIAAVVASFIDSISAIAAGVVEPAAKRVEQTMANTLVVVVGFLAKFAGLGGIPAKLVGIVKKIRAPIDRGLDKIVAWLGKIVSKVVAAGRAGVARLSTWWTKKVPVAGDGETHTLKFEGAARSAHLVLRSTPEKPSVFLGKAADQRRIVGVKKSEPIAKAGVYEKQVASLQAKLGEIDDNSKRAAAGMEASEADQQSRMLDTELAGLGAHIGQTLSQWGASDGKIEGVVLDRASFSPAHKQAIAEEHLRMSPGSKDLLANKDGRVVNLRKGLDRRHVVSSADMAGHYEERLNGKKWSEGKILLEQRASIAEARTPVPEPLSLESVKRAAKARYQKFFGYAKNIFIGDSSENRSIQEHLDAGHPEMAGAALQDHVRRIKRSWTIDDTFKETPVKQE